MLYPTSNFESALIFPLNVETPVTFKFVNVLVPEVFIPDSSRISVPPTPVSDDPSPKYVVAVTELIPDIFVRTYPQIYISNFAVNITSSSDFIKYPCDIC